MSIEGFQIKTAQIALPLSFDRQFSFDNYFSQQGELIVDNLTSLISCQGESMIGLWGRLGSGKTHLLNACAHYARQQNISFQLYDGLDLAQYDAEMFEDLESCQVLVVDNLDALCGIQKWEEKFYQIINVSQNEKLKFIFSLTEKPTYLNCRLADFQSRLSWGLLLQLQNTGEKGIANIIKLRAAMLGIELSEEAIRYLLTHYSRQLSEQIEILRVLDNASLSAQKRITIPLIKQTLAEYYR